MTPQVAYMQILGLETLDVRYQQQAANALWLAKALQQEETIAQVNYIGLPDNPYYDLSQQQFGPTAGTMLTIDLESREVCFQFLNRLKVIHRATNLFDSRTLAIHPASTIFGLFPDRQLAQPSCVALTPFTGGFEVGQRPLHTLCHPLPLRGHSPQLVQNYEC